MAIALDAATAVTGTTNTLAHSFSHTVISNTNGILWVAAGSSNGDVASVTANGVNLTHVNSVNLQSTWVSLWYLVAPSTGINAIVVNGNFGAITGGAASFTGAKQTGIPDSHFENISQTGAVTSYSISTTTVADNCFLICSGRANGGATLTGGTNTTVTQPEVVAFGDFMMFSAGVIHPAGTGTLNCTSASQQFFGVIASFSPVTFTSSVLKVSSVPQANISKIMGVTNANARKIAGVQNQP